MNDYLELIKQAALTKSLASEEIIFYISEGSFRITTYCKNNIVHFVGETCSKLEIILAGKVAVERIDESGNLMTIAEFLSGEILGGNLLFSRNPHYPMTITVKQPSPHAEGYSAGSSGSSAFPQ